MRASLLLLPVAATLLTIAACQPSAAPDRAADPVVQTPAAADRHSQQYQCDGVPVHATFTGSDAAEVVVGGTTHAMTLQPAASGARYGDAQGNVFWTRGMSEATLALKGQPERQCTVADPAAGTGDAVAADTAQRAFRATGNEPGWRADVAADGALLAVDVDYGQTRYEVTQPSAGADGWAGSAADGTPVKLSIQQVPCQDDMSGETFEAKAMLTVGARQLHGCGRFIAP